MSSGNGSNEQHYEPGKLKQDIIYVKDAVSFKLTVEIACPESQLPNDLRSAIHSNHQASADAMLARLLGCQSLQQQNNIAQFSDLLRDLSQRLPPAMYARTVQHLQEMSPDVMRIMLEAFVCLGQWGSAGGQQVVGLTPQQMLSDWHLQSQLLFRQQQARQLLLQARQQQPMQPNGNGNGNGQTARNSQRTDVHENSEIKKED